VRDLRRSYRSDGGSPYYYNQATRESLWDAPPAVTSALQGGAALLPAGLPPLDASPRSPAGGAITRAPSAGTNDRGDSNRDGVAQREPALGGGGGAAPAAALKARVRALAASLSLDDETLAMTVDAADGNLVSVQVIRTPTPHARTHARSVGRSQQWHCSAAAPSTASSGLLCALVLGARPLSTLGAQVMLEAQGGVVAPPTSAELVQMAERAGLDAELLDGMLEGLEVRN
jgi:hypothetical protein